MRAFETRIHMFLELFRRFVGAAIAVLVSRAQLMKRSAKGLSVRFLTVMIAVETRGAGKSMVSILSPAREALNCATDLGSSPTNCPVPIRVAVRWPDNVTMLGRGACISWAWKISRMSEPGTLSYGGRIQGASARSASTICRRRAIGCAFRKPPQKALRTKSPRPDRRLRTPGAFSRSKARHCAHAARGIAASQCRHEARAGVCPDAALKIARRWQAEGSPS